jgi:hypothetical protein
MLRALCLAMPLFVLPLGYASPDASPELGTNAALKYWQAFAMLPKFTDAEQKKFSTEFLTMPLDEHARGIVTRAEYALRMLHRGAALRRCNWGLGWEEEGIDIRVPHNDGARVLVNLACLRARIRFEEGRSAEAIDDLVAAMTLARHASQDGINVMLLAGYASEHRAIETLALYLPKLNAGMLKDLKTRLDASPAGGRPATALKFEEEFALNWFVRKVQEAKDKGALLAHLSKCCDTEEKGRAFLEECGGTAEGVLKCAEETRKCYRRMATKLDLPVDQFEKEWQLEETKLASNPVFKVLFPAIERVRWIQARMDVRRALLSTALAVQLDGSEALTNHPDPVVGGPFDYVPFGGGFELRSKLKLDDKLRLKWQTDKRVDEPVVLTVGRRGQ